MKIAYIYGLIDPITNRIRYIGYTKNKNPKMRLYGHISEAKTLSKPSSKNNHKNNWIRKLLNLNIRPRFIIIEIVPFSKRKKKEKEWIAFFGKENLVNATDGGDGGLGRRATEEEKLARSLASKGRPAWNKGIPHTQEAKDKMSKTRKGRKLSDYHRKRIADGKRGEKNPNYGKSPSEEQKAKTRAKVLGKKRPGQAIVLQGRKRKGGKNKYVGVYKRGLKWNTYIWFDGKQIHVGLFYTAEEAAMAYDKKALELYGKSARLNFPDK